MEAEKQDFKTGTTTVGIVTTSGIVLGADKQATLGHLGYDLEANKIYKITDKIAVTNAGSVGDSLMVIRFLRSRAKLYETEREAPITPKALTTFLSNVLNANRHYPFAVQFIIGGLADKPQLFEITPFGGVLARDKYATSGSGTQIALAILDQNFKPGMTEEEGIALAVKAVAASKRRDIYTGGRTISVTVIDGNGVRELPDSEVNKHVPKEK